MRIIGFNILTLVNILALLCLELLALVYSTYEPINGIAWAIFVPVMVYSIQKLLTGWIYKWTYKKNRQTYEANNINFESGQNNNLLDYEIDIFPKLKKKSANIKHAIEFNTIVGGNLADLKVSYQLTEFADEYARKKLLKSKNDIVYNYIGKALTINYSEQYFDTNPIIYYNKKLSDNHLTLINLNGYQKLMIEKGMILHTKDVDLSKLNDFTSFCIEKLHILGITGGCMIVAKDNRITVFGSEINFFEQKVMWYMTPGRLRSLLSSRKAMTYRYNQLINKMATIFDKELFD